MLDTVAATPGFRPQAACRSSDYRFMTALVGAGVGLALVPRLAQVTAPGVRSLPLIPSPAADHLLALLRVRAEFLGGDLTTEDHRSPPGRTKRTTSR